MTSVPGREHSFRRVMRAHTLVEWRADRSCSGLMLSVDCEFWAWNKKKKHQKDVAQPSAPELPSKDTC